MLQYGNAPTAWNASSGDYLTPVSYTHLDVYKRQPPLGGLGTGCGDDRTSRG